ncbi:MAG: hypothetical protein WD898_02140 [Candidatus Paceibacterota bacterium]
MEETDKFKQLIKKVEELKRGKDFDLSLEEDLSIAVMNLISLEEHFFFTASKTGEMSYLDLLNETRAIRKSLLGRMVDHHEGETWCISKHLLAATMRLMEVGTKLLASKKQEEAEETLRQAYRVYSLFWSLRLKLLSLDDVKKIPDSKLNIHDKEGGRPWKLEDIVNKLVDCCDE